MVVMQGLVVVTMVDSEQAGRAAAKGEMARKVEEG